MSQTETQREGWAWPSEARKEHYFRNGRSLCGKWGWLGGNDYLLGDSPMGPACVPCERKAAGL